jgi:hypothetical protein
MLKIPVKERMQSGNIQKYKIIKGLNKTKQKNETYFSDQWAIHVTVRRMA